MSKKKIQYPIHKMGKHCGYQEYEDGSIKVAPRHYQKMDDAALQEEAVDALLKSLTEQCHKLLMPILASRRRFWQDVAEDYSLDNDKWEYYYHPDTQLISKKLREAPE